MTTPAPTAKPSRKKYILRGLIGIFAIAALGLGVEWYVWGRYRVTTDDAFIGADFSILTARVAGTVQSVELPENAAVNQGDILVKLDDADFRLSLDAANQRLETQGAAIARIHEQELAQQANIAAAQAELVRDEAAFTRASTLNKSDFASTRALDDARAARDGAKAALEAAKAGLNVLKAQAREAQAQLKQLQTAQEMAARDLSFTQIAAPFDGVIGNRTVEAGQYVQPGTRLLALVPLKAVYVDANFKETQIAKIKPGQKATIAVDAFGMDLEGEVASIAPASGAIFSMLPPENATGNFTKIVQRVPVRIRITDAKGLSLRPGLSVIVTVDTQN